MAGTDEFTVLAGGIASGGKWNNARLAREVPQPVSAIRVKCAEKHLFFGGYWLACGRAAGLCSPSADGNETE